MTALLALALSAAALAAPTRPLTPAERATASATLGGRFSAEEAQSFRVTLTPVGEVDVLTGDDGGEPAVAVLQGDKVLQRTRIDPTPGRVNWGGVEGVAFVDLDKDGQQDILVVASVCSGMNCQVNAYRAVVALLQRQGGFLPARAWANAIPYDVVAAGLGSVKGYAKARPAHLAADEEGKRAPR